jgi:hypothetical protein
LMKMKEKKNSSPIALRISNYDQLISIWWGSASWAWSYQHKRHENHKKSRKRKWWHWWW